MRNNDTVTASEIAVFVFCGESWRLRSAGAPSENVKAQEVGVGGVKLSAGALWYRIPRFRYHDLTQRTPGSV